MAAEVVVAARRANEAARRIGLQPALVFAPVPDPVLGPEHPPAALAVEHREVAYSDPERARLHVAGAPFLEQIPVSDLRFGEWIDSHAGEYGALVG